MSTRRAPKSAVKVRPKVVGVIAPSAVVPKIELEMGIRTLKSEGFEVRVHPHTYHQDLFYAGSVEERAQALVEFALDPEIDLIWCARGGSGAFATIEAAHSKLARHRSKLVAQGEKGKQILGYSDITVLLEYMSAHYGWQSIHCPMPSAREFAILPSRERLMDIAGGQTPQIRYEVEWLDQFGPSRKKPIRGKLVGGNLTVWSTLVGTPFRGRSAGTILFFEEITEAWYRIDRMMAQMASAGAFEGVQAIVLGTFTDCPDSVMTVLNEKMPRGLSPEQIRNWLKQVPRLPTGNAAKKGGQTPRSGRPIRKSFPVDELLQEVFARWSERLGIPVGLGLPCGHGEFGYEPLPLGVEVELDHEGTLKFLGKWS